ncbi:hypothetical protein DsansV1_C32g0221431 [Dioscorea sansibarensis]
MKAGWPGSEEEGGLIGIMLSMWRSPSTNGFSSSVFLSPLLVIQDSDLAISILTFSGGCSSCLTIVLRWTSSGKKGRLIEDLLLIWIALAVVAATEELGMDMTICVSNFKVSYSSLEVGSLSSFIYFSISVLIFSRRRFILLACNI